MKQLTLPLKHAPAFDQKDFIVSSSNQEAYLWLLRWPEWPKHCLTVYGEKGCGKTHLSYIWQKKATAMYIDSSMFNKMTVEDLMKGSSCLVIDDAHLTGDDEKLFHIYNHIMNEKGGLLLLSETPPAHWNRPLPDLQSRLNGVPAVKIHSPDEELLIQVAQKRFADLQIKVEEDVICFLLKHIERSFESVHTWIDELNRSALIRGRSITIPLVREYLLKEEGAEKDQ